MTFDLEPDDQIIPAGKQIGLMIFSSDREFTLWPEPGTRLTIDLNGTSLTLPVVGGKESSLKSFAVLQSCRFAVLYCNLQRLAHCMTCMTA